MIVNAKELLPLKGIVYEMTEADNYSCLFFADINSDDNLILNLESATLLYKNIRLHSICLAVSCHIDGIHDTHYEIEIPIFTFTDIKNHVRDSCGLLYHQDSLILDKQHLYFYESDVNYRKGLIFEWTNIKYINKTIFGMHWKEWAEYGKFKVDMNAKGTHWNDNSS